jgi:restriction system protein
MVSQRLYDKDDPRDRDWQKRVRATAKQFIEDLASTATDPTVRTRDIYEAFQRKEPELCDDAIRRPENPNLPKWMHALDNALQAMKSAGKVSKATRPRKGEWLWGKGVPAPPTAKPVQKDVSAAPDPVESKEIAPRVQPVAQDTEPPPPPQAAQAPRQEHEGDIRQRLLDRVLQLSSDQFELLVGEFLKRKGFSNVHVTGRPGDGGIDGDCEVPFLKLRVAFQAKLYGPDRPIGSPAIRNFKGGVVGRFDRGILITTSSFSAGAVEEAEEPGVTTVLINGVELVDQMVEIGLAVTTVPVLETHLDEDFFAGLGASGS